MEDEQIVFFGAGASGAGCAMQMRRALRQAGVPEHDVARRVLCLDSQGLILQDRIGLAGHKREIAASPDVVTGWTSAHDGRFDLADVVRHVMPTVLVGVSGRPGAFSEEIIRAMHAGCARPIVLALSNPTDKIEARRGDILQWTNGAAIVGTGSPFPPVDVGNTLYQIGQCNNVLVFPGVGLGATAVGARWLPDEVFGAAAKAVYEFTGHPGKPGASIFPPLSRLREVSRNVAVVVARAAVDHGAAPFITRDRIERRIERSIWEPVYRPYRPA